MANKSYWRKAPEGQLEPTPVETLKQYNIHSKARSMLVLWAELHPKEMLKSKPSGPETVILSGNSGRN